jgi:hypothetical protein
VAAYSWESLGVEHPVEGRILLLQLTVVAEASNAKLTYYSMLCTSYFFVPFPGIIIYLSILNVPMFRE